MSPPGRCASTGMNANSSPTMQSCDAGRRAQTVHCWSPEAATIPLSASLLVSQPVVGRNSAGQDRIKAGPTGSAGAAHLQDQGADGDLAVQRAALPCISQALYDDRRA